MGIMRNTDQQLMRLPNLHTIAYKPAEEYHAPYLHDVLNRRREVARRLIGVYDDAESKDYKALKEMFDFLNDKIKEHFLIGLIPFHLRP